MGQIQKIRNFSIISHIDHGKSTLADRLLEITGTVEKRKMQEQFLDSNPIERERGITIKLQPVRMLYRIKQNGEKNKSLNEEYILNLIDTPGHVDFAYEVSRSLAACEGAILLVDATQGIQAQTVANAYLAIEEGLEIIPVINKIDLPAADIEKTKKEIKSLLGGDTELFLISAKEGSGVSELLKGVLNIVPPPEHKLPILGESFKALVFDSEYDSFQGVIAYVRVFEGEVKRGDKVYVLPKQGSFEAQEVGFFTPDKIKNLNLKAGEIGYIATGLKDANLLRVGATLTNSEEHLPLSGYKEPKPMVFASLFLEQGEEEYGALKDALYKLYLNDPSLFFELDNSSALGRGFRCGFLGLLHLEIVVERLKREFNLSLIVTKPTVAYEVLVGSDEFKPIHSAEEFPEQKSVFREPWVALEIFTPAEYLGRVLNLLQNTEGQFPSNVSSDKGFKYISNDRLKIDYEAPLREIILGFYDALKAATSGFASLTYDLIKPKGVDLVKLDILVAGEEIKALSEITPKHKAEKEGRKTVKRLKEILPKQLFAVAIQAVIGGKIIARETLSAMRKDVTGYLYGGDVTRKKKLLEKQKRGKKRLKQTGRVNIPHDTFIKLIRPVG